MALFFRRLGKRYTEFFDGEIRFLENYVLSKYNLYRDRWREFNFFHGWALFIGWSFVGFFYGLVRLSIYSLSFLFRLFFIPFRLFVESHIPWPFLRRFFFFCFTCFESVFGLLLLREICINGWDSRVEALQDRFDNLREKFLKTFESDVNNPVVRFVDTLERWDAKMTRRQRKIFRWILDVFFGQWLGTIIPNTYRHYRHRFMVRFYYFFSYRLRRFRKWRGRKRFALYLSQSIQPYLWLTKVRRLGNLGLLRVRWGFCFLGLGFRFLWNVLLALVSPLALIGRRCRSLPSGISQRFRRKR